MVPATRDKVLTANPDAIFGLAEYGEEPPISEYDRRWRGAGGGATGFDLGMQRYDFAVERYKKTAGVDMAVNELRKYPLKAHTWDAAADEVVDIRNAEVRLPGRPCRPPLPCRHAANRTPHTAHRTPHTAHHTLTITAHPPPHRRRGWTTPCPRRRTRQRPPCCTRRPRRCVVDPPG